MGFRYLVCDVLSRKKIGDFDLYGVSFGDPLGAAGQFTGKLSFDPDDILHRDLMEYVETDRAALYVVNKERQILWPGLIVQAPWDHDDNTLTIEVVQMSAWLSTRLHGQLRTPYVWTNKDQFQIARELVAYATSVPGTPLIKLGTEMSGVMRDLSIAPQSYIPVDELIDSMANRENGFDWSISARFSSYDGLPELYLELFYPERQSLGGSTIFLESLENGGNILSRSPWPNDASRRRTRVIAVGEGEVPSQAQVYDEHPGLEDNLVLLKEEVLNLQGRGIVHNSTLVEHARGLRSALSETSGTLTVDVAIDNPPIADYLVGDRARLRIKDPFLDVDLPAVRIVERTISGEDHESVPRVTLTLDLSDIRSVEDTGPRSGYSNYQPQHQDYMEWVEVVSRIRRLEQRGTRIPTLGADPASNSGIGIWMLADGRIRWRAQDGSVQQAAITSGSSTSAVPEIDPTDQTIRYQKNYASTWTATYLGSGEARETPNLVWGNVGDGNGDQKAVFGFDYAMIQDDLFDANIVKVELWLDVRYTYARTGMTVNIGTHYATAAAGTFVENVPGSLTVASGAWKAPEAKFNNMPLSLGELFKDGVARGIVLSARTTSRNSYGYAAGFTGGGVRPHLRITYDK